MNGGATSSLKHRVEETFSLKCPNQCLFRAPGSQFTCMGSDVNTVLIKFTQFSPALKIKLKILYSVSVKIFLKNFIMKDQCIENGYTVI